MKFLVKNLVRLIIAVLAIAGAIVFFVMMTTMPDFELTLFSTLIGFFIFFAGTAAYMILKMLVVTEGLANWVLMLTGLAATVFFSILLVEAARAFGGIRDMWTAMGSDSAGWVAFQPIAMAIAYVLGFGLLPFTRGVGKIYHRRKERNKK